MPLYLFPIFVFILLMVSTAAGWVNNVIWTFQQDQLVPLILGIVSSLAVPFGALHGLYLFFT